MHRPPINRWPVTKSLLVLGMAGATVCICACAKATPETAWKAYHEKRFDDSIRDWSKILKKSPKSGEALYGLGVAYLATGNGGAAELKIARSLDLLESRPEEQRNAYVQLCDLYLERHRTERVYLDGVWQSTQYMGQRYPNDFDFARINASAAEAEAAFASSHSDTHSAEGWWAKAVTFWEDAAKLNPDDARVLSGMGRSCEATRDLAKADQSWRRLLQIDPGSTEAQLGVVSVALSSANPAELSAVVRGVVDARPDDAKLLTIIAERLVSQRHTEEYKIVAAKLEQLAREKKLEWLVVGQLYERAGMSNEALRSYQEGAGSNSRTANACLKSETRILLNEHRNREAQQGLDALKARHVQDDETEMLEALFLLNQGLTEDAISKLIRIGPKYQNDRNMTLALARAYVKHEEYALAANLLETWDRHHPDDVEILSVLAESQSKMGDLAAAAFTADRLRKGQLGH